MMDWTTATRCCLASTCGCQLKMSQHSAARYTKKQSVKEYTASLFTGRIVSIDTVVGAKTHRNMQTITYNSNAIHVNV